jgi:hypothetical protein
MEGDSNGEGCQEEEQSAHTAQPNEEITRYRNKRGPYGQLIVSLILRNQSGAT